MASEGRARGGRERTGSQASSQTSSDDDGHRGRARSRTFSSHEDTGFGAEIDLLNAELDGRSPEEVARLKAAAATAAAAAAAPPPNSGISSRALKIVSQLDAAVAPPEEEIGAAGKTSSLTLEEEEEELRLAELEKRKRLAAEEKGERGAGADGASGARAVGGSSRSRRKDAAGDYDVQIKLLLLGDSGVGKTSLMLRYSEDKFSPSLLSTAGVDYKSALVEVGGKKVKCQVWDTAGQQRFHVITHSYYKGAHGIILVYDVADPTEESFNNVRYWMENIDKHASPGTAKILIGNKIDIKGRKIDTARGKALADEYGMRFAETSAKDGQGVRDAFLACAKDVLVKMAAGGAAGAAGAEGGAAGAAAGGKPGDKDKKDCAIM